jgi:hypothetical protein
MQTELNTHANQSTSIGLSMDNIGYDKSIIDSYNIEKITNSAVVLNITNGSMRGSVETLLSNCDSLYHKPTFINKSDLEKLSEIFLETNSMDNRLLNLNNSVFVRLYNSFDMFSLKDVGLLLNAPSLVTGSYLKEGCISLIKNGEMTHYIVKDPFSFMIDISLNIMNPSDRGTLFDGLENMSAKHNSGVKYYVPYDLLLPKLRKGISEGTCLKLSKKVLPINKGVSHDPVFNYLFNNNSSDPNVELEELLLNRSVQNVSIVLENEAYIKNRKNILFALTRSSAEHADVDMTHNCGILNLLYLNSFDTSRLGSYIQIDAKSWINDTFRNSKVRAVLTRVPFTSILNQALSNPYNHIRTNLDRRLSNISFNSRKPINLPKIGDTYGCLSYDFDTCNKIIDLHNVYGRLGKQLYNGAIDKLNLYDLIGEKTGVDAGRVLTEAISFKKLNPDDTKLNKLCYNSDLAPEEMKREMVESYINSPKSLEQISVDLSRKYGLNVSSSTISSRARKHYDALTSKEFKNRREVQEYYHPSQESSQIVEELDSKSATS